MKCDKCGAPVLEKDGATKYDTTDIEAAEKKVEKMKLAAEEIQRDARGWIGDGGVRAIQRLHALQKEIAMFRDVLASVKLKKSEDGWWIRFIAPNGKQVAHNVGDSDSISRETLESWFSNRDRVLGNEA